jgi:hypothetical protein
VKPEIPSWWLDDAAELNRRSPDSFFIPRRERRENLVLGDQVKLVFRFEGAGPNAERMWVDVVEAAEGSYVGELRNQPYHIRDLEPGARVAFRPEHVAAIAVDKDEVGYDVDSEAVVSRRIRDEGEWPYFAYRMPPRLREAEEDSGWQLWARHDNDEFAEDPENLILWELGWITDKFPPLEALFASDPEEGQWWWDEDTKSYRARSEAGAP